MVHAKLETWNSIALHGFLLLRQQGRARHSYQSKCSLVQWPGSPLCVVSFLHVVRHQFTHALMTACIQCDLPSEYLTKISGGLFTFFWQLTASPFSGRTAFGRL